MQTITPGAPVKAVLALALAFLPLAELPARAASDLPLLTARVENPDSVQDWGPILNQALAEAKEGDTVRIPGPRVYPIATPVVLKKAVILRLDASATLEGRNDVSTLISLEGHGRYVIEGNGGRARLENPGGRGAVIEVMKVPDGGTADLTLRELEMKADICLRAMREVKKGPRKYEESPGSTLGELRITDCRLEGGTHCVAYHRGRLRSLHVEGNLFTGAKSRGLFVSCPISEGAFVRGNRVVGIGSHGIWLGGGKANMVDDGAMDHLSNITVHDNQVIDGGREAGEETAYAVGILVYGRSVSIQGNIVRDFNRGEPVPGERIGHHFKLKDGTWHRGPWLTPEGKPRRRLAGAAIYAKATDGIIANNVCVNSGWRAVIEVKTGGRFPYFLVANNVVDGSSLAIEESFGFEPNVAKAMWVNNLVYNMPNMAFKVSNRMQSVYSNNVIYDSKIGFRIDDVAAEHPELIANNRFYNVETPIQDRGGKRLTADITPPIPIQVPSAAALPAVTERQRGQLAVIRGGEDGGDRLVMATLQPGNQYGWSTVGATGEGSEFIRVNHPAPAADPAAWRVSGPNLVSNPRLQRISESSGPSGSNRNRPGRFPADWALNSSDEAMEQSEYAGYEEGALASGELALRIGGSGLPPFRWILQQRLHLEPGKTYRATVRLRRSSDKARTSLIVEGEGDRQTASASKVNDWEEISVVFRLPEGADPTTRIRLHGNGAGEGNTILIESVTLGEAEEDKPREIHG